MKVAGVLEGGGVKGIALVGALQRVEAYGIHLSGVGGTSAGSMVAALFAAGYTPAEMRDILLETDFAKLLDPSWPKWWDVWRHKGVYKGEKLYQWLYALLQKKGVLTFKDLRLPLRIVASDLTNKRIVFADTSQPIVE
jgi:NTE family protein